MLQTNIPSMRMLFRNKNKNCDYLFLLFRIIQSMPSQQEIKSLRRHKTNIFYLKGHPSNIIDQLGLKLIAINGHEVLAPADPPTHH